ncbi:CZB domain-containing protein [Sphingomonas morindae]|uniref:CZB domain-containing protein n=1 Tax=Sphingomonas morindae TaxID=1541170 RepID=A0ABY4X6R4_9SPHN|nr:CZB domain-containing protein [Sphingomonas morindae]USI72540.1 CZB domain-containing protein [Sphingomonas morindae]
MDFEEVAHSHSQWKVRFRTAIYRKERLDAAVIGRDDCCLIGRWLYGEGAQRFGASPAFRQARDRHRAFHREAGAVAALINAGRFAEAEAALGNGTPYANASTEVVTALGALRRLVPAG